MSFSGTGTLDVDVDAAAQVSPLCKRNETKRRSHDSGSLLPMNATLEKSNRSRSDVLAPDVKEEE